MAITFNTGTTASNGSGSVSLNITIPAGVLAGDVILVAVAQFKTNAAQVITASSTGTAPVQIGSTVSTSSFSGQICNGALFYVIAGASDAGKVITVTTAGAVDSQFAIALGAYTGASNTSPIDVSGSAAATGNSSSITCPSETTGVAGDWDIQLVTAALGGATFSGGAGFTSRETISDGSSGASALLYDSNASVGGIGTGIGGAVFSNTGNNSWWIGWTVGLAPASAPATSGTVQPLSTFPTPRRKPGRAVVNFIPVVTVNTGHGPPGRAQPLAASLIAPRRKPSRAVVQFIPVTTINHPAPPPKPQHGTPSSDEARGFKRWLLWGP